MKASEVERVRELEAAIASREREIENLKEQKSQLQSQLVTMSSSGDDLLACYPVYEYCGRRAKKNIRDVPVEQVGNMVLQFEVATRAVQHQNAQDAQAITELKHYIREQQKSEKMWLTKRRELADKTGIDLTYASAARRSDLMNLQAYQAEASAEEVDGMKRLLQKEINAANVIRAAKGRTIELGHKQMEERNEMINAIDQLYNNIRVADRDLDLLAIEMDKLRASEEGVIQCIEDHDSKEAHNQMLVEQVEQLVVSLKEEREVLLLDKCEPQERLLKAQDFRLRQLERRLKATERCLRHNCSIKDVNAILESKWDNIAPDALEMRDDLLDLERVIPSEEKVHPALYNLFLREKEKLAQSICKINILVAEKESVMASQACRLEALSRACNQSIQELDDVANNAAFEEEKQRRQALDWARQQRNYYCDLLQEKSALSS